MNQTRARFQRIIQSVLLLISTRPNFVLALLKSAKNRSPKEEKAILTILHKFHYCRDMALKEGTQKLQKFSEYLYFSLGRSGETVIRKGEHGQRFYLLLKGSVNIILYIPKNKKAEMLMQQSKDQPPPYEDTALFTAQLFKELKEGDHFGDLSLIDQSQASATVVCKSNCEFACMDKHHFWSFLGKHQPLVEKLHLIRSHNMFSCWTEGELRTLSYEFKMMTFHQGHMIFEQGTVNNGMYLIQEGYVELSLSRVGKQFPICRIDAGQIFGDDGPQYSCNAKCGSARAQIYRIDRSTLFRLFEWHPDSRCVYDNSAELKRMWRMQRVDQLESIEPRRPQLRRPQSMLELEFEVTGAKAESAKFQKLLQSTTSLRRLSNHVDTLDLDTKKEQHKEILRKLNKVQLTKQVEFFNVTKNFKEARRKEQSSQTKFMRNLMNYLKRGQQQESDVLAFELEERTIRTSSQIGFSPQSTQQRFLSPISKQRKKQLSIQGITLKR